MREHQPLGILLCGTGFKALGLNNFEGMDMKNHEDNIHETYPLRFAESENSDRDIYLNGEMGILIPERQSRPHYFPRMQLVMDSIHRPA